MSLNEQMHILQKETSDLDEDLEELKRRVDNIENIIENFFDAVKEIKYHKPTTCE